MYFKNAKRIVIKLGSSTIVDKNNNFKSQWLKSLIADIKKLRKENKDIVIVSSGAIALGKKNLKIKTTANIDGNQKNLEISTNLTNSVQTPDSIELSMIIVKLESI